MKPVREDAAVDLLHQEALEAGEDAAAVRRLLAAHVPEEGVLLALLRRALPARFLELLATTRPWSERPAVLARVVLNPRTPRAVSLRLVSSLFWRHLADVAMSACVPAAVRVRAEGTLLETLPEMRLGDRITLAKIATPSVLAKLLADPDAKVVEAALLNPRLREEDLVSAVRRDTVAKSLVEAAAGSPRWKECYAVRLSLALQPRTPLPIALLQLSSLAKPDLIRVAGALDLAPLVQAAALATAERLSGHRGHRETGGGPSGRRA